MNKDLKRLWLAVFCLMFGFGVYSASFMNFASEELHVKPHEVGILESIRELPGFLCVFVAALTMRIAEPLLASFAFFLVFIGMLSYAGVSSFAGLLLCSFIWSVGLHTWLPLQSSITLNLAEENSKGKRLGQTMGVGSLGTLLGMVTVLAIGYRLDYKYWFFFGSLWCFAAAMIMLGLRRDICCMNKPNFVWKKRYRLYYILTFLEGCRKQVFFTFALYALVKVYGTRLQTIALLMVINQAVNMYGGPFVGRLIDRIGERKILLASYTSLIFVFIGYALIKNVNVLYILYCLDNLFFLSSTCLTTYIQKVADPQDVSPTLSLGVTMNHTAAVLVPLIGGYLWARFSYPITFLGGAVVVIMSIIAVSAMKTHVIERSGI